MRLLTIVHQDDSGPGVFAEAIASAGVQAELWKPAEYEPPRGEAGDYEAILSFGGETHPVQDGDHPWLVTERGFLTRALEQGVPMLGVCLGSQLIAQAAGARARLASRPEIGWYEVGLTPEAEGDPLFAPLVASRPAGRFEALQWHSYEVELPAGAVALARSPICLQSYRIGDRVWGIQFHAEVTGRDFQHWLDLDGAGPEAVDAGLDVAAASIQTREQIEGWNELGRGLCQRFLRVASQL